SHPRSPIPDPLKQLLHEPERRLRRCVAPVEPSVYCDRHIVSMGERDRGEEVLVEGVHAAVPDQADEVERGTTLFHAAAQLDERRPLQALTRPAGLRDPHDALPPPPPRAPLP